MRAREYKYRYNGGKEDDITVIVALIKEIKLIKEIESNKETKPDISKESTRDSSKSFQDDEIFLVNNCSTIDKNLCLIKNGKYYFIYIIFIFRNNFFT
jgi:hypothetical protein